MKMRTQHTFFIILAQLFCSSIINATIGRPRGVSISMASLYQPAEDGTFTCLDGSSKIPYEYVNDDYCDCNDGTDEPGTSACPNGKFHCTNAGYVPSNILSSRVNDGVCDCCDGTDEDAGRIECVNNCKDLGKKLREEQDRTRKLQQEGFEKQKTFSEEGKRVHEEKISRQAELEKERETLEVTVKELETAKLEAESPETEAKDKHQKAWDELKAERQAKKEVEAASVAFKELDTNGDNSIELLEIIAHIEFDIDSNGVVSEEEAKEHLEDKERVDYDTFVKDIWPHVKDIYKKPSTEEPPPEVDPSTEARGEEAQTEQKDEESMPEYDEETKKLIEAADEARKNYDEANSKLKELDNELSSIKSYLEQDYGPNREYAILQDQCFEYTDREYTYKYCPFSKGSQRPKSGGHETSLGNWGNWAGPENDKYSVQLYEKGQNCWNGPDRSVKVHLKCGLEHRLLSSSEPSRCEYAFEFETPCRCSQPAGGTTQAHDEL
ncbi:glucosidase 2 subunit beta-like isoform X4 [Mytilus californianus]|uniref:glucosidase 2 subunit beta-like isoform X4 n=1 Tax=Mytilus californianus TaxID=6549 RepID=UPI002246EFFD|nr:glucosidase 2 subunit beta-like isoform X4 [Mytilus californianus]